MSEGFWIRRLALLGVGLIGGSLARALREAGVLGEVIAWGPHQSTLERARKLGVIDVIASEPGTAAAGADMVVLAAPLGAFEDLLKAISGQLQTGAVITDVGSAKGSVVAAARRHLGPDFTNFVPGHPIAGTEKNGVEASFASLFRNHRVILTPVEETAAGALEKVRAMWQQTGAEVEEMAVAHHDEILAATSHLPHMLAYSLVDCLAGMEGSREVFRFAAGGFEDFTRIASSSPRMWHDIVFANREALVQVLDLFDGYLQRLGEAIRSGDSDAVLGSFERAKAARDRFVSRRRAELDNEHGEC